MRHCRVTDSRVLDNKNVETQVTQVLCQWQIYFRTQVAQAVYQWIYIQQFIKAFTGIKSQTDLTKLIVNFELPLVVVCLVVYLG